MSRVIAFIRFGGQYQCELFGERFKLREIMLNQFAPLCTPRIQMLELFQTQSRGNIAHVELAAWICNVARAIRQSCNAVKAQHFSTFCFRRILEYGGTTFNGGHILVRVKAEQGNIAKCPNPCAFPATADGKRSVFDDPQIMFFRNGVKPIHLAG